MGFDSKCDFAPPTVLLGLLLSLGHRYLFLVGSNILLSMVVQQRVVLLESLQEKMSTHPSTLPFYRLVTVRVLLPVSLSITVWGKSVKTHRLIPDKAQKVKPGDLQVSLHMVFIINSEEGQDCPSSQGGWAAGTFAPLQNLRVGEGFRLPSPGEPESITSPRSPKGFLRHTQQVRSPPPSPLCGDSFFFFFPFIFISWRLITLQYCSGFCHTLT